MSGAWHLIRRPLGLIHKVVPERPCLAGKVKLCLGLLHFPKVHAAFPCASCIVALAGFAAQRIDWLLNAIVISFDTLTDERAVKGGLIIARP